MKTRKNILTLLILFVLTIFVILSIGAKTRRFGKKKKRETPVTRAGVEYTFEKDTMGWINAWGNAFDKKKPLEYSTELATENNKGALQVNLVYEGAQWEEANIGIWIKGEEDSRFDLTRYEIVEYDVYLPVSDQWTGLFKIATAFDKEWAPITEIDDYKPYEMDTVTINGKEYVKIHRADPIGDKISRVNSGMLVIRLGAYLCNYQGPIYVDNILIRFSKAVEITIKSPEKLEEISGKYKVVTDLWYPPTVSVKKVTFYNSGKNINMKKINDLQYECIWDTTKKEGFQDIRVEVIDKDKKKYSRKYEVFVNNSPIKISILSPAFDSTISGIFKVKAKILGKPNDVSLRIGDLEMPMVTNGTDNLYQADLDTKKLKDSVYALIINAKTKKYKSKTHTEVIIENDGGIKSFVKTNGINFMLDGQKYYFAGLNAYDLPFKEANIYHTNMKGISYTDNEEKLFTIIKKGPFTFEQQIDRTMIEAKRLGLNVMRTWGFNTDVSLVKNSFYTPRWQYNKAQFERFDYIMDSARRHGIRVIIALQNYWSNYGGIVAATRKLKLKKLDFFYDPKAKKMFKNYMKYFISRKNSISGIRYKDDPTVFAWELMNEPRIDIRDDMSLDESLWDQDGTRLAAWFDEMSTYIKSIDKNHLVAPGAEGHGEGEGWHWKDRDTEGYGTKSPIPIMDKKNIDFFTFHPYPNAEWIKFNIKQTKDVIKGLVKESHERNKPMIMEEWGIDYNQPLRRIKDNKEIKPDHPDYPALRVKWMKIMLETFRKTGATGNMIWMLQTNLQEPDFGLCVFTPAEEVEKDRIYIKMLKEEAKIVNAQNK